MDNKKVKKFLQDRVEHVHTFSFFMTGNNIEALQLTETTFQQFFLKFDEIPSPREASFHLINILLKHAKIREPEPDKFLEPQAKPGKNLFDQTVKEHIELIKTPPFQRIFTKILIKLPLELKIPVILRDTLGFEYRDIAIILGIPETTLGYRLAQARGLLIDALRSEPAIPFH